SPAAGARIPIPLLFLDRGQLTLAGEAVVARACATILIGGGLALRPLLRSHQPRTGIAAEYLAVRVDAVADDPATAVLARRRQQVNGAFEAVEDMRLLVDRDREHAAILVSAYFTSSHRALLRFRPRATGRDEGNHLWMRRGRQRAPRVWRTTGFMH